MYTFSEYNKAAQKTAIYKHPIMYPALGLAEEAGETCGKIKKVLRDNDGYFSAEKKFEIIKELGDVLWYVQALAHDLGFSLEEVAVFNIQKLTDRQNRDAIKGSGDNR